MKALMLCFLVSFGISAVQAQSALPREMTLSERILYSVVFPYGSEFGANPEQWLAKNFFLDRFPSQSLVLIRDVVRPPLTNDVVVDYTIQGRTSGRQYTTKGKLPKITADVLSKTSLVRRIAVVGDEFARREFAEKFNARVKSMLPLPAYGTVFTVSGRCVIQPYDFDNEVLGVSPQFQEQFGSFPPANGGGEGEVLIPIGAGVVEEVLRKQNVLVAKRVNDMPVQGLVMKPDVAKSLAERALRNDPKKVYRVLFYRLDYSLSPPSQVTQGWPGFTLHRFEVFEDRSMKTRLYHYDIREKS